MRRDRVRAFAARVFEVQRNLWSASCIFRGVEREIVVGEATVDLATAEVLGGYVYMLPALLPRGEGEADRPKLGEEILIDGQVWTVDSVTSSRLAPHWELKLQGKKLASQVGVRLLKL